MSDLEKVEKIPLEKMQAVLDGSISVKEMHSLNIPDRCNYIVRKLFEIQGGKVEWWDFDNEGGNEGSPGYFDPDRYKKDVGFTGEFKGKYDLFLYQDYFPTKWIWIDFEDDLKKEYDDWVQKEIKAKIDAKSRIEEAKKRKKELTQSALAKLSKEECKALGYRKPKE